MNLRRFGTVDDSQRTADDDLTSELRAHAALLSPDELTLARIRARARGEFDDLRRRSDAMAPRRTAPSFLGRRVSVVLMFVALLAAVFGDFGLLAGLSVYGLGSFTTSAPALLGGPFTLFGTLVLVVSVLELLFACGAWVRRDWAWPLGIFVSIASVVVSLAWVLTGAMVGLQLLTVMAALVILVMLDQSELRDVFGKPASSRLASLARR